MNLTSSVLLQHINMNLNVNPIEAQTTILWSVYNVQARKLYINKTTQTNMKTSHRSNLIKAREHYSLPRHYIQR